MGELPPTVSAAYARSADAGFDMSCDQAVGRLLAVLSASTPHQARILELGSGVGVGLSWIVHGLGDRLDVEIISVELDEILHRQVSALPWPETVNCLKGDAVGVLTTLGSFDLIFADAQGGKWERLDLTIAALNSRGVLIVDDMTPPTWLSDEHELKTRQVARTLLAHPGLTSAELTIGTGVILATKSEP